MQETLTRRLEGLEKGHLKLRRRSVLLSWLIPISCIATLVIQYVLGVLSTSVHVLDSTGKTRFSVLLTPDGSPLLGLYERGKDSDRGTLGLWPDGKVGLELRDRSDRLRLRMVVDGDDTPKLEVLDAGGK